MARNKRTARLVSSGAVLAVTVAASAMAVSGIVSANAAEAPGAATAPAPPPAARAAAVGTALPTVETRDEFDDDAGANADADAPIIWVNPKKASASLVFGTLKDAGLSVFNLAGTEIQRIASPPAPGPDDAAGRLNNVDIFYGIRVGGSKQDIVVVSDRGRDQLRFYQIDATAATAGKAPLKDITDPGVPFVFSADQTEANAQANAYGLAAFDDDGTPSVLVSRELTTDLGLVKLVAKGNRMSYQVVRKVSMPGEFKLPDGTTFAPCQDPGERPQSEGMVVDQERGVVYVGQEDVGLWKMDATLKPFKPVLIDKAKEFGVPATFNPESEECEVSGPDPGFGGKNLSIDVEGITIYHRDDDDGYLMVSSQGDSTYAVYELEGRNTYLGSFQVGDNTSAGVDGTQDTDSFTVTNVAMGAFTKGLAVFADGENTPEVTGPGGEARDNTNFKFVPWENIAKSFNPPLDIDTESFDPRDD